MMLRTSSNKLNPTGKLIGFSVRKNIGLTILASIAMLIICPGLVLTRIFDFVENNARAYDFSNVAESMILWITAAASIGVVLLNILNFSYLFSKKSSDVFHSVPLKRGELLFARCFSGIINVIVPVLLGYLSMIGIILFMPVVDGEILPLVIGFAYTLLAMLFCSAFSMIFIVCAGTAFDWAVSFFGINIGSMLVGSILLDYCYDNLRGYYPTSTTDLFRYISPPYFLFEGITKYTYQDSLNEMLDTISIIIHFAVCLALTVIFYLISLFLYRKRPAEKGGDSFAFRFIYVICSLLVGFCCGYALALIFDADENSILFYAIAGIGAILSCVIYGVITDRGFKKVKSYILTGVISFIILAATFLSISFDVFGFSKRIPEAEKIEYVSIGIDSTDVVYDDPTLALDIHKTVYDMEFSEGWDNSVLLTYKLKNGLTMTRKFWYESEKIEDLLMRYAKSEERIQNIEYQIESAYEHFDVDFNFKQNGKTVYAYMKIDKEQMQQIFELYKKELVNANTYSANRDYDTNFSYNIIEGRHTNYEFFGLNISEDFPETRKLLDELFEEYSKKDTSADEKIG